MTGGPEGGGMGTRHGQHEVRLRGAAVRGLMGGG